MQFTLFCRHVYWGRLQLYCIFVQYTVDKPQQLQSMQDNISNVNIAKRLEYADMSNCLLNVVVQHLRFYYAVAESVKNSRDVVFIVFAGKHKIVVLGLRE